MADSSTSTMDTPTTMDLLDVNISSQDNASNVTLYPLFKQDLPMILIQVTMNGVVVILSVLGNLSVLCVVIKDSRFHSATYFFIANLAVADLLMAVVCQPITVVSNIVNGWLFGAFMCKAVPYLQGVSVSASVNTLVVIAVDRYMAICHVMRQRNTKRMARVILVLIWAISLALMTPWAVYYTHDFYANGPQTIPICVEAFPHESYKKAFFLGVIFLMCYSLPLLLIGACYFLIGYRVWNRDAPGITSSKGVIEKSKVRVVKMLVVVVLLFMFSWMPLYILRLTQDYGDFDVTHSERVNRLIAPFAQWIATSNSCMNPLVYCLFSQKIRRRIRAMLCCTKPEARSLYSTRSTYNSALQHSTSTRDSLMLDNCVNGNGGHFCGTGSLYHHRPSRQDSKTIRWNNVRSTHV